MKRSVVVLVLLLVLAFATVGCFEDNTGNTPESFGIDVNASALNTDFANLKIGYIYFKVDIPSEGQDDEAIAELTQKALAWANQNPDLKIMDNCVIADDSGAVYGSVEVKGLLVYYESR